MTLQSTAASIQNVRKQRQLDLELVELDRRWHVELKVMARERLGLIKDLCRMNQQQKEADHFQASLHGKALSRFTDKAQDRRHHDKELKKLHKFDFQPDPVDRMNLHLPPLDDGGDIAQILTSKDLYKQRVLLQKTNFEHCMADRRNRRRPFWDKAVIGERKKQLEKQQHGVSRQRAKMFGMNGLAVPPIPHNEAAKGAGEEGEGNEKQGDLIINRGLSKSPSLPALHRLRRGHCGGEGPLPTIHPSLSNNRSASLDYLPVIKSTRGQHGLLTSLKGDTSVSASSSSSTSTLPTIAEV